MLLRCPACKTALASHKFDGKPVWKCSSCGGMATTVAVVRAAVHPTTFKSFWVQAARDAGLPGQSCPGCERAMQEVSAEGAAGGIMLDVCRTCQLIWFDRAELPALPRKPPVAGETEPELPPEAKRLLAMAKVDSIRRQAKVEDAADRARFGSTDVERRGGLVDFLVGLLEL